MVNWLNRIRLFLAICVTLALGMSAWINPASLRLPMQPAPTPIEATAVPAITTAAQIAIPPEAIIAPTVALVIPIVTPIVPIITPTIPPNPSAQNTLTLTKWVDGLTRPTYLTYADNTGLLYVTEQAGKIWVIDKGQVRPAPFLDITDRVRSTANEQGLLSMAFSPNYARDRAFWVNYTDSNGDTTISKFVFDPKQGVADPNSEQVFLSIKQPYSNHNGGQLKFGPDGMLYIGMGDGGSQGDPNGNGQNLQAQLGKLLRIDVLKPPAPAQNQAKRVYSIPENNPFASQNDSAEVWAYGLRNPWRFSFDRKTGDLYIADVGQSAYEEINFQPAKSKGGENYGWNKREGFEAYRGGADRPEFVKPIHAYGRSDGCSVTGGYVYRGAKLPMLQGAYLFGDYCSGKIWQLQRDQVGNWQSSLLFDTEYRISSFGEDANGELYMLDLNGAIYMLTLAAQSSASTPSLSQASAQRPRLIEFYADW